MVPSDKIKHPYMKAMIEGIDQWADKLWVALQNDTTIGLVRTCDCCGADKRIEAIWAAGDGMQAIPAVRQLLNVSKEEMLSSQLIEVILAYALAKYPPEKCEDDCDFIDVWSRV